MNTPIYDFIREYGKNKCRMHMPGHKGNTYLGPEYMDITEVLGADELYAPSGIIAESEENASRIFGCDTYYTTEGSSHGIRSMLLIAKAVFGKANNIILAVRNAHKALIYGAAIAGIDIKWIYSGKKINSTADCIVTPGDLRERLLELKADNELPFAVFVTSPNYLGEMLDIRGLKMVCAEFGLGLLVDNAHGAYLHFLKESLHPLALGADMCCDSGHKTLPVLTPGAYLHIKEGICDREMVKYYMQITGSSSPSYLIMASLDYCNHLLSEEYGYKIRQACRYCSEYGRKLNDYGIFTYGNEPMKLTIEGLSLGYTGIELGNYLRGFGIEAEFCDVSYVVLMPSAESTIDDFELIFKALKCAKNENRKPLELSIPEVSVLKTAMTVRESVLSEHEIIEVKKSVGRICAAPVVSCPPAIPIVVSGEVITENEVRLFEFYGIERVAVTKRSSGV